MPNITSEINGILGIDDAFKAPSRVLEVLFDRSLREHVFAQFLELFNYKLDADFFHTYFQEEAAERKKLKQDFTPMEITNMIASLTADSEDNGMRFEATAGTGGMTIALWARDRAKHNPWRYNPSDYLYVCEELSNRAYPFLAFNMAIRGMNGVAIHCDSLSRECCGVILVQNDSEHPEGFSSINVMPYNKDTEAMFHVKFTKQAYKPHIESPNPFECETDQ